MIEERVGPGKGSLPSVDVRESYRPRRARFLELWQPGDWLVKLYGITYEGAVPPAGIVKAAKRAAAGILPDPARTEDRYGVGVVIVHHGQDACWLLVDWWGHESILHHRLLMAPLSGEQSFRPAPIGVTACVWELPLLLFERDAWVATILTDPAQSDVGRYLECRFNGDI